ncbi:MAG TPA: YnbE family lipoprotein [Nitrospira sp.]|nr:YnbE family lipoprotein [Nitrospira sp.]
MQGGTMRISVDVAAWVTLLLTLGACTPRAEVAALEKPITINLNVKSDHEIRLKVDKDLDQILSNDSGLLDEDKANGLVGEKSTGYLATVNPSDAEAQALIEDVNHKRRQAYEDIAKRNRTSVQAVETLAGEKAIQNTKPGNFIEGPGGWMKK